jgi:hypothetical protein
MKSASSGKMNETFCKPIIHLNDELHMLQSLHRLDLLLLLLYQMIKAVFSE